MRRLGEFVLRHRALVVVAWLVIAVAGAAVVSTVNGRTTVNFSLPGQPGDTAANKIIAAFHNGANTQPLLATVTMPQGQTITGHEAEVGRAFASLSSVTGPLRVVDEANTGDRAFRTSGRRTRWSSTRSRRPWGPCSPPRPCRQPSSPPLPRASRSV
jgi:RND superfamily putative drug exporter